MQQNYRYLSLFKFSSTDSKLPCWRISFKAVCAPIPNEDHQSRGCVKKPYIFRDFTHLICNFISWHISFILHINLKYEWTKSSTIEEKMSTKLYLSSKSPMLIHKHTHIKTHGTSICISVTTRSGNKVLPPFKDCMATMTRRE